MQSLSDFNASESHFKLSIPSVDLERITVLSFETSDQGISQDYSFYITAEISQNLDINEFINKQAQFSLQWDAETLFFNGIVSEASYVAKRIDGYEYTFRLSSPLYPLTQNKQSRVYLNKSSDEIVKDVLIGAGILGSNYEFKTTSTYYVREFTIQHNESDFEFINRLMKHDGMFFIFKQDEQTAKLQVYDDVESMPVMQGDSKVLFDYQSGQVREVETVFAIRRRSMLLTDSVSMKDFNYRTPEVSLEVSKARTADIMGQGMEYKYGENYKTIDEGQHIATIRQQAVDWQRDVYVMESDCRGFTPGSKFTLSDHPDNNMNGDYRILEVEHNGEQKSGLARGENVTGLTYRNRALAIRAGIPYRPIYTEPAVLIGIFTAKIETTGGEYAYLDAQGRYRIRMPFDLDSTQDGEASHTVRMMQPYTGQNYGLHFPLHAGTEVALACTNGDRDRPIILGVVSNPDSPSTVTAANHSTNTVRTWGGNELSMDDRKGLERIDLFTRDKKNILTLDANEEGNQLRLATEEGEMEKYAKKTMLLESGDTQTVQVGNDHNVLIENKQTLMTKNEHIEVQSATDIEYEAGSNILCQAETEDFILNSATDLLVQADNDMSIDVRNENLEMQVTNGNTDIQAARSISVIGSGGGVIHVGQSGGVLEVATSGNLTVDGPSITITAPAINIRGNAVGNN